MTGLIQNKTKAFYKTNGAYSYNQWNYFQGGCMDKWRSGDFSIQTRCIPLEAFAFKNLLPGKYSIAHDLWAEDSFTITTYLAHFMLILCLFSTVFQLWRLVTFKFSFQAIFPGKNQCKNGPFLWAKSFSQGSNMKTNKSTSCGLSGATILLKF